MYGIGEVGAKKLIEKFGSLEQIYENIEAVSPESTKKKLIESVETAYQSKKLATIVMDAPISNEVDAIPYKFQVTEDLVSFLKKYNFKSLMKRLGVSEEKNSAPESQASLF